MCWCLFPNYNPKKTRKEKKLAFYFRQLDENANLKERNTYKAITVCVCDSCFCSRLTDSQSFIDLRLDWDSCCFQFTQFNTRRTQQHQFGLI